MQQASNRTPEIRPVYFQAGAAGALILAGIAAFLFLYNAPHGFPVDDAYIHLVYAKNLANGHGFSFNQGEPSFGTTSPLWVLLLAIFIKWVEPVILVRIINVICLLASTLLVYLMAHNDISKRAPSLSNLEKILLPLAGSALFCFSGNLLWIYFCGMETPLFLLLGLLAIFLMRKEKPSMLGGAVLGLLVLTRMTGGLLVLLLLAYRVIKFRRIKEIYPFMVSGLVFAPFGIYFLVQFHHIFPTTMGGKLASNLFNSGFSLVGAWNFFLRHINYLLHFDLALLAILIITIILLLSAPFFSKKKEQRLHISFTGILGLWAAAHFILHAFTFRSTYTITPYHNLRYQVMIFPAVSLLAMYLFSRLAELVKRKGYRSLTSHIFISTLVSIFVVWSGFGIPFWKKHFHRHIRDLKLVHQSAALWVKENLPEDARLGCFDIGSLKFYSDRHVIDLGGLIEPSIHRYLDQKRVGRYLIENHATHYLEMTHPSSKNLTGVRNYEESLYWLKELEHFVIQPHKQPVFLHSFGMKIYEIKYLEGEK